MEFKTRLQQLLDAKDGGNMTALANFCGVTPQAVQQWVSLGRVPRAHRLAQIAEYFSVSEQELIYGDVIPEPINTLAGQSSSPRTQAPLPKGKYRRVVAHDSANIDLIEIRRVKLTLSAGITGFNAEPYDSNGRPLSFRADWFVKKGYSPEKLISIDVKGESMEPIMSDGDTVVINTADVIPKDGLVYAINFDGEAVIKRMVRDFGRWFLVSDNPDQKRYHRQECTAAECIVIGRVVLLQRENL